MKTAFLDTSILISREFDSASMKQKINQEIEKLDKYATDFTKAEINCSIMKDAVLLHNLLVEEMDLPTVFGRLQKYPFTERRRKRCLALLEKVSNRRQLRLADAVARLESVITGLYPLVLRGVKLTRGGTGCQLISAKVEKHGKIYKIHLSCTRQTAACNLEHFIETNKDSLDRISAQSNIDQELSGLLKEISNDTSVAKGRNCLALGDIIVCLESPTGYTIYSTNIRDFAPICKAIQKQFIGIK